MPMQTDSAQSDMIDERFVPLLERLDLALFTLDRERRFVFAAPAFERITGYPSGRIGGKPFDAIVFQNDAGVTEKLFTPGGGTARLDIFVRVRDSAVVKCTVVSRRDGATDDAGWIGILFRTAAADPEAEEKIRMFTIAVEQSPATVVITDQNGSIEYVNPKFTALTGYSFNEALGHNPRILKSGEQNQDFYRAMWETITSGREWRGEFHNVKKNGESYWESASISPIRNLQDVITHYIAVKEDITERKRAEEALRISEENLRKKNQEMEQELVYAQAVISRLLPARPPRNGRLRVDFRYIPLDAVGGDFFSFNTLHDRGMGVFIGDVVGHGVSAALFLSLVRSLTERLSGEWSEKPERFIAELNRELMNGGLSLFLTALYGYFNFSGAETEFRFAKGGHPPPIRYRAADSRVEFLYSRGMPVGINNKAEFSEERIILAPGDRLYCYTDGIIETRNAAGALLDLPGLSSIVAGAGTVPFGGSLDFILDEVNRFRGSEPIYDDIVIIGFEVA